MGAMLRPHRRVLGIVSSLLLLALVGALAAPADAGGRRSRTSFQVFVDDSAEGCTLDPSSSAVHGGTVRMSYSGRLRPFLRLLDGTVVRFNDVRKVTNLPNGTYDVFTTRDNLPDGPVKATKRATIDCPLPVNHAPTRFSVSVDAPLPEDPPLAVAVADVMASAIDIDGDPLSVTDIVAYVGFNTFTIDDNGTPGDLDDDVLVLDTNQSLECGTNPTANLEMSDGRGGVTRYATLVYENPFGPYWLCGNPW